MADYRENKCLVASRLIFFLFAVFIARVAWVIDGDTVVLATTDGFARVRLAHIDAPEKKQLWGYEATQTLRGFLPVGELITYRPGGRDKYRRTLAELYLGGVSINRTMVDMGAAWSYDKRYRANEKQAKALRLGLWGRLASPYRPDMFRRVACF